MTGKFFLSETFSVSTACEVWSFLAVYIISMAFDFGHKYRVIVKALILVGGMKIISYIKYAVVSPQSARQYEDKFRQHYDNFAFDLGEPNRAGQDCYDATWILALALNNTLTGMVLNAVV